MSEPVLSKLRIRPLLLGCFVLVALIPIVVISINMYRETWIDAWREIHEKHQLLAENLASPISIYVTNHREMLSLLAQRLRTVDLENETQVKKILQESLKEIAGFNALMLLDKKGILRYCINRKGTEERKVDLTGVDFFRSFPNDDIAVSHVMRSPISDNPAIFLTTQLGLGQPYALGASLGIDYIEQLRRQIRFGKKGHSAIVDHRGHVIAHPNPEWMLTMHDLSHLSVVKRMMEGDTGVTEFYSPFIKQDMVAGYTHVPGLGWGVMVPQPRSEVADQVRRMMMHHIIWGAIALIMAIGVAFYISRKITHPINELALSAVQMLRSNFQKTIPLVENAPKEIAQMARALKEAVTGLEHSRVEYEELNESLQIRVEKATADLLDANRRLEDLAKSDHLTKLANRRHFETHFNTTISRRNQDKQPCVLLLLDVDNFKNINDNYGHAAGDIVLSFIAEMLRSHIRDHDLIARYGGDEFIALMHADKQVAMVRAEQLSDAIEQHYFYLDDHHFNITVSIGLLYIGLTGRGCDRQELFKKVDAAMYTAKKKGRNTIVEVSA